MHSGALSMIQRSSADVGHGIPHVPAQAVTPPAQAELLEKNGILLSRE
jgi:hypothetical protein